MIARPYWLSVGMPSKKTVLVNVQVALPPAPRVDPPQLDEVDSTPLWRIVSLAEHSALPSVTSTVATSVSPSPNESLRYQ